jgi:hypothetical protein
VSGFIPLPALRNIRPEQFKELGERLKSAVNACPNIFYEDDQISDCWAHKYIVRNGLAGQIWPYSPSPPDRFADRTTHLQSCIIMHQKQEWLCRAAIEDPGPDVFVWIDYGVLKQTDMTEQVVRNFCDRLLNRHSVSLIEAPGISERRPVDADEKSWDRFCGSVVIEPRKHLFELSRQMKAWTIRKMHEDKMISIESNTLAHMEYDNRWPIRWYQAWWGAPMFDNLPAE